MPTIVLVHGAFAESASWNGVIDPLVAAGHRVIAGLVYVAGFAPEAGESCFTLADMFAGSTLADTLEPVARAVDATDLLIAQRHFHAQFAADVPAPEAMRMAATQRPIAREALLEPSGAHPLWKEVPSWFAIGEQDRNIPAAALRYMAERAGAQRVVEIPAASHAVAVSHPRAIADLILEAAALRAAA